MAKHVRQPRGRPRDDSKRGALLRAARRLLLAKGLDVTTDEIAAAAKVAKATLYANFADKQELVEAVIRRESDRTITDEEFEISRAMPIEAALLGFGVRYLKFINQRDLLGWDQLIASASAHNPSLSQRFFAAGPGRGQSMLSALIAEAIDRGELQATDPVAAADDLSGLWLGFVNLKIKLRARAPLTGSEIEARVSRGLRLFMTIYGRPNAKR
jgi:TetR/AcrR family transcriptional regulator, mexJK operon transcriptional repressor